MWTLLIHLLADTSYAYSLLIHTQTLGHVMSQKRGKHSALIVGEVCRAEDGREEQGEPQDQPQGGEGGSVA